MEKVIIKKKTVFSEYKIRKEMVSKKVQKNYSSNKDTRGEETGVRKVTAKRLGIKNVIEELESKLKYLKELEVGKHIVSRSE